MPEQWVQPLVFGFVDDLLSLLIAGFAIYNDINNEMLKVEGDDIADQWENVSAKKVNIEELKEPKELGKKEGIHNVSREEFVKVCHQESNEKKQEQEPEQRRAPGVPIRNVQETRVNRSSSQSAPIGQQTLHSNVSRDTNRGGTNPPGNTVTTNLHSASTDRVSVTDSDLGKVSEFLSTKGWGQSAKSTNESIK